MFTRVKYFSFRIRSLSKLRLGLKFHQFGTTSARQRNEYCISHVARIGSVFQKCAMVTLSVEVIVLYMTWPSIYHSSHGMWLKQRFVKFEVETGTESEKSGSPTRGLGVSNGFQT